MGGLIGVAEYRRFAFREGGSKSGLAGSAPFDEMHSVNLRQ